VQTLPRCARGTPHPGPKGSDVTTVRGEMGVKAGMHALCVCLIVGLGLDVCLCVCVFVCVCVCEREREREREREKERERVCVNNQSWSCFTLGNLPSFCLQGVVLECQMRIVGLPMN